MMRIQTHTLNVGLYFGAKDDDNKRRRKGPGAIPEGKAAHGAEASEGRGKPSPVRVTAPKGWRQNGNGSNN